jgi:hypothetical protein
MAEPPGADGHRSRVEPASHPSNAGRPDGIQRMPTAGSRVGVALVALLVFGVGAYAAWVGFAPRKTGEQRGLGPGEVHRIRLSGPPQPTAAGEGAVWTAVGTSETEDILWRIDAVTEQPVPLPNTKGAGWPAVGEGFAWVTCLGKDIPCRGPSVLKLDPRSGTTLATISLPEYPIAITAGLGAVWVAMHEGLAKIDPLAEEVTGVFQGNYSKIGTAGGSVWAASYDPDRVYRIDPTTGAVLNSLAHRSPCTFEASQDVVWIASCDADITERAQETLTKFDAVTAEMIFQAPLASYGQMRVAGGSLWMALHPDRGDALVDVVRLDPENGEIVGEPVRIAAGEGRFGSHGEGSPWVFVAADDRSLWLTDFGAGELIRLALPSVSQPPQPSSSTAVPTTPGVASPVPGTGLQTVPETLAIEAELRGDSIEVTNRNEFHWRDCNVQINTEPRTLEPWEHPVLDLLEAGNSETLFVDKFQREEVGGRFVSLDPNTLGELSWRELILACQTPHGSAAGRVEFGPRPEEGPPYGSGAEIGRPYELRAVHALRHPQRRV